jgi:hypothetical protein
MKVIGKKAINRVNPNGVLANIGALKKLKKGKVVDLEKKAADELLDMGFVKKANNKIKEANNG